MSVVNLDAERPREKSRLSWLDLLGRHRLLAGIGELEMRRVFSSEAAQELTRADGDVILEQGQLSDSVFFIGTGAVSISLPDQGPAPLELAILRKGDFFGETVLFGPGARAAATVTALQECVLLEVPGEAMRELMIQHPALELAFLRTVTERLRDANERILSLKLREVPEALRLLEARLSAEVRVFDASLKAAHTVFEQTRVRTDEVISSADRTRSRLTYVASTVVTVFTLVGMFFGAVGLGEVMKLRNLRDEADRAAATVQAFNTAKPELEKDMQLARSVAEEAQKLNNEFVRVNEVLVREQVLAIRTALDHGEPSGAIEHFAQLEGLGWVNDSHLLDLLGEVEGALRARRDASGVVSERIEGKRPDFERLLDRMIEKARDPKTQARAYLLRLVNANLVTGGALGDDDRLVLAQFHRLLEQHRADGLLSGVKEWEHEDFLPEDPQRREAFRKALRQVTATIPKDEAERQG